MPIAITTVLVCDKCLKIATQSQCLTLGQAFEIDRPGWQVVYGDTADQDRLLCPNCAPKGEMPGQ